MIEKPETITIDKRDDGYYLVGDHWPKLALFSRDLLRSDAPTLHVTPTTVTVFVQNGQAVYEPVEHDDFNDTVIAALLDGTLDGKPEDALL